MKSIKIESPFFSLINDKLGEVEERIREKLKNVISPVGLISQKLLSAGGKRIRPSLVLLCNLLFNKIEDRTINLAAMVEIVHMASLIHDDVMDEADLRRGLPSANKMFGNRKAVLSGDYFLAVALNMLTPYLKKEEDIYILKLLGRTMQQMCEGEIMQINYDGEIITEEIYLDLIKKKTASLISASCELGGWAGGGDRKMLRLLSLFGISLGQEFQIIDDLLDLTSNTQIGKPAYSDFISGRLTLPLIYTYESAHGEEKEKIKYLYHSGLNETSSRKQMINQDLLPLIKKYQGKERAKNKAEEFASQAKECLNLFRDSGAKSALIDLTEYVLQRKY